MDIGAVMLQLVSVFAGSNPACSTSAARHTSFVWGQGFAALLPFSKGKIRDKGGVTMPYIPNVCPDCGCPLDPGEKCDCQLDELEAFLGEGDDDD